MANAQRSGTRKGAGASAAASKRATTPETPDLPTLEPIDVAKLEEIGYLVERLVDENEDLFIAKAQKYREAHREGTKRPLTAEEAVSLAMGLHGDDRLPEERAEALQNQEGLYVYEQPEMREMLLSAGAATAPAAIKAARQVVALIEMPKEKMWAALDGNQLPEAIAAAAEKLRRLDAGPARERASAAFSHLAAEAGDHSGKGPWLMVQTMWQALSQAMSHLASSDDSQSSLLLRSALPGSATDAKSSSSGTPKPAS